MKILVTGGGGFIGKMVVSQARNHRHTVTTYDAKDGHDILDKSDLAKHVCHCDGVVHLAGRLGTTETFGYMERTLMVNISGAINVFEAAKNNHKKVVYLGTKVCNWYNPYLISKRTACELALMYSQYQDTDINVVRAMNVYGPGQHWGRIEKMVPTFIVNAIKGDPLKIYGDGKQVVDLIHVYDIAEIILKLMEGNQWGLDIEAGTGIATSINAVADMIIEHLGSYSRIEHTPMRIGEPPHSTTIADTRALNGVLDYWPQIDLADGMKGTIDWYRDHYQEVQDYG